MADDEILLGLKSIAVACRMSVAWCRKWSHPNRGARRMPTHRVGGTIAISELKLKDWLSGN